MYAIGDVHGCANLLIELLDRICDVHPKSSSTKLIFLGDLVDRGPNSAEVIAIVRALEELMPAGAVDCLMGNHERMMIDWLNDGDELWLINGGHETMASFGFDKGAPNIPGDVMGWLERRPTWREDALRIYVHAGLRPGVPVDKQRDRDRLWIREGFLDVDYDFGKHVIHGHTPSLIGPERRPFRTNIDTGAVYGGALTAAVLDDRMPAPIDFFQVPAGP
ncbi:MAG TPA: metallophosphoesterase family protein [Roseiarcus sp.]|nr:metallophosphoesterase family protein [Roseiarcus sp.]